MKAGVIAGYRLLRGDNSNGLRVTHCGQSRQRSEFLKPVIRKIIASGDLDTLLQQKNHSTWDGAFLSGRYGLRKRLLLAARFAWKSPGAVSLGPDLHRESPSEIERT